jgi:hypothetical protein
LESLKGRDHSEDESTDVRIINIIIWLKSHREDSSKDKSTDEILIILKWTVRKQGGRVWTVFIWLRKGTV